MPYSHIGVKGSAAQQALAEALAALSVEFDLPDGFGPDVLAEVETVIAGHTLPEPDLTALPFITIDPPGSLDLDQAMYLERKGSGYVVHYAIADVPSFVPAGGALDTETRRRGQTFYTPGNRIPLHPVPLSEGAASLFANNPRSAFVWEIELAADGSQLSARVRRATVRSIAKLGYAEAQDMLDAGTAPADYAGTLELLREIGTKRIGLERARGGASLNVPAQEVEFVDGRYVLQFRPALPLEDWNAQISLLTGMAAAQVMLEGKVGILRTMPAPDDGAVAAYRMQTVALGKPWEEGMEYGAYLRTLDTSDPRQLALMHAAATLFRGAGYTPFNGEVPEEVVQAAVAAPYAHATAPLRRLVDRFVLAICAALCSGSEAPDWAVQALDGLPEIMSASNQLASKVDKAAIDTVEAALLSHRVGTEFDAVVLAGPRQNGHTTKAGAARSTIQIADPAVTGYCEGALEPGTVVRVKLVTADIARRTIQFVPAAPRKDGS
ncbi:MULTISPECIES: RNB domain-containing ribonuclease [unclassified Arthrobacter]|uniref:RNB domain-containing ribonuclease n=1 Tax=unclassified Arthrobacter TaxID=235627 RepID=UPI002119D0A2|nr:RNB domain-containing ribonuclease [Arthrobacter sp. STN4]MCQ9165377.1 RNB domain-containing ribonuclease [Arthrobacter sp. STN4]